MFTPPLESRRCAESTGTEVTFILLSAGLSVGPAVIDRILDFLLPSAQSKVTLNLGSDPTHGNSPILYIY